MRTAYPFFTTTLESDLWKQMDRMFDGFEPSPSKVQTTREIPPTIEIAETEEYFMLSVDLPGVKKDDIKIELLDKTLTISGERRQFEKVHSTFKRRFALPTTVSADQIEAHHDHGVLQLYIPKTKAAQVKTIEIQSDRSGFLEKLLGGKKAPQDVKDKAQVN